MIRIQQKVLFICMMSNIVLNFGLAFGNVEEELVPDNTGPKNLVQFMVPLTKDAGLHVDCINIVNDMNEILSKMKYDSTAGNDWLWDLNKAAYLHQLCASLPVHPRSMGLANPEYHLVADKYQPPTTAKHDVRTNMNVLEDEDGPTFQHKHFYFNKK